ncbi:hypothetical protein ACFL1T_02560 [Chlamydiota bacterium]
MMSISLKVFVSVCLIFVSSYIVGSETSLGYSFKIIKVSREELLTDDEGKPPQFLGERHIEKFSLKRELQEDKKGEVFTVFWKSVSRAIPEDAVYVMFAFRRNNSIEVEKKVQAFTLYRRGKYEARFENIGKDYFEKGKIETWKIAILYQGKILAQKLSAQWSE